MEVEPKVLFNKVNLKTKKDEQYVEKYKKTNYLQSEIKKKALDSNNGTDDGSPEYFLIRSSKGFTLIHFS